MTDFYTTLRDDLNDLLWHDPELKTARRWTDSSFHHDACGSVMLDFDHDGETYVQLFAFETAEEAAAEDLTQFSITTFINGAPNYTAWEGHERKEAMEVAHEYAKAIKKEWVPVNAD